MGLFKKKGKHASDAKKVAEAGAAPAEDAAARAAADEEAPAEGAFDEAVEAAGEAADDAEAEAEAGTETGEAASADAGEGAEGPAGDAPGSDSEGEALPVVEPLEPIDASDQSFVDAGFGEIPRKKGHHGLKAFGITVGVLAAAVVAAYIAGAVVFMGRFLPNTTIGDYDISMKTDAEIVEMLDGIVPGYRFGVIGNGDGFSYRTTGEELGLSIDAPAIVSAMHDDLNAWEWPLLMLEQGHDETARLDVAFDEKAIASAVTEAVEKFNETAKDPVNATIVYDADDDEFAVKPEEAGTKYDVDAVLAAVTRALDALEPKLVLGDEQLVQPTVLSTDEQLVAAAQLATGMVSAHISLVMGGVPAGEVDGDTLSEFITVGDGYEVVFKEDEMNAWVDSLVDGFNTVGTERTYTRADGKAIAVSGGVYGWEVDTDGLRESIIEAIKEGDKARIEIPCIDEAAVYNGPNQRDWGNRYIDVDISEQHVRFYGNDGEIIWEADCISGAPDGKHDTVEGVWMVNAKESPSKLIGYENGKKIYETSVKYWMPFEGNGIGFHDATWQPSFGGSMYANGYGSHGCVNLPVDKAHELFDMVDIGTVVVVHW